MGIKALDETRVNIPLNSNEPLNSTGKQFMTLYFDKTTNLNEIVQFQACTLIHESNLRTYG